MSTIEHGVVTIPIADIRTVDDFNPRTSSWDKEAGDELAASIANEGVLNPLWVRALDEGPGWTLVAGERRLYAAAQAGLTEVPCLVVTGDRPPLLHAWIENRRENLAPFEEAKAIQRLAKELGIRSQKAIAERLGLSPAVVQARLALLKLPDSIASDDGGRLGAELQKTLRSLLDRLGEELLLFLWNTDATRSHIERNVSTADGWAFNRLMQYATAAWLDEVEGAPFIADLLRPKREAIVRIGLGEVLQANCPDGTPRLTMTAEEIDAAVKGGFAVAGDVDYDGSRNVWARDEAWMRSELEPVLVQIGERNRQNETEHREHGGTAAANRAAATPPEPAAWNSAEAIAERTAARQRNDDVGAALLADLGTVEVNLPVARLMAAAVLDSLEDQHGAYAFVDSRLWIDRKTKKLPDAKYLKGEEVGKRLGLWLEACRTPEECFALVLRVVIGAAFADSRATTTGDRQGRSHAWGIRGKLACDHVDPLRELCATVVPAHVLAHWASDESDRWHRTNPMDTLGKTHGAYNFQPTTGDVGFVECPDCDVDEENDLPGDPECDTCNGTGEVQINRNGEVMPTDGLPPSEATPEAENAAQEAT